ncbi:ABC transporter substrate-binding protein [Paenibacillus turpanensis]|uniref:ABC transporter substrate-binding protein n=1 Tax=Paenibacillus turpanensis TaxID=2689078 RepID=UPI00140D53E6|nr:extracellular solute-binding protein [Paenibacillus turpanensis]
MKRFANWSWFALYVVVLAATVLMSTSGKTEPIEEDSTEKMTLTFRHFWTKEHDRPMLAIFEDVVQQFQHTHPNVKVNFEGMDQTIHREQRLKSEMVTGNPPDLFVLFGGAEIEPYVRSNRLMDLTGFVESDRLRHPFNDLNLWTFDGRVYGLPIEGNAEPLFYNQDIFHSLGLKPPETLAELTKAIQVLSENGYIPMALGNGDRWPAGIYAHYVMDRFAGPALIDELAKGEREVSFFNLDYIRALKQLDQWAEMGAFPPGANSLSREKAIELFTQGRAAMYLNGNWDITLFHNQQAPAEFERKVGVLPFPALGAGGSRSMAGGYTFGIGMSAHLPEAKREAAFALMEALYSEEVQTRIVYEGRRLPAMRVPYDPDKTGPIFAQVLRLMEKGAPNFVPYDNILPPEVKRAFLKSVEELIDQTVTPEEALEQMESASDNYWQLRRSSAAQ